MASKANLNFIPTTNEELYNHYFKKVAGVSIVGTLIKGIMKYATEAEFEELSNDVFVRMVEKNVLKGFDPKKGNFGGSVFFVTRTICVNHLERKARDPLAGKKAGSLVETHEDGFELGSYAMDKLDEGSDKEGRAAEAGDTITKLATHLEKLATRAGADVRDQNLIKVLELLAKESAPSEIAEELGFTKTTIANWMGRIAAITTELKLV